MHDAEKSRPKDEADDSEATSKETVKDLEADEIGKSSSADNPSTPSPDGLLDDGDADPMRDEG
jgi:hypothetical protein